MMVISELTCLNDATGVLKTSDAFSCYSASKSVIPNLGTYLQDIHTSSWTFRGKNWIMLSVFEDRNGVGYSFIVGKGVPYLGVGSLAVGFCSGLSLRAGWQAFNRWSFPSPSLHDKEIHLRSILACQAIVSCIGAFHKINWEPQSACVSLSGKVDKIINSPSAHT